VRKADNLPHSSADVTESGSLNLPELCGPHRPVMGLLYLLGFWDHHVFLTCKFFNNLTQKDETWYEIYGKGNEFNVVISKFLQLVITWRTHETLENCTRHILKTYTVTDIGKVASWIKVMFLVNFNYDRLQRSGKFSLILVR
jgi:hypothetical protein